VWGGVIGEGIETNEELEGSLRLRAAARQTAARKEGPRFFAQDDRWLGRVFVMLRNG
jgi:hypothetical protein